MSQRREGADRGQDEKRSRHSLFTRKTETSTYIDIKLRASDISFKILHSTDLSVWTEMQIIPAGTFGNTLPGTTEVLPERTIWHLPVLPGQTSGFFKIELKLD